MVVVQETLDFRLAGISPALQVTHANILSCVRSKAPHGCFFAAGHNAPLPLSAKGGQSLTSVQSLAPLNFRRNQPILADMVVSCYTLFKGWLLLSQPPTCLRLITTFHT